MDTEKIRIVELPPMRVASFLGFGQQPELQAFQLLMEWAGPRGLLAEQGRRVFGFNNPDPSPGSPNYGYEVWITVGPEVAADSPAEIKQFSGGYYAVSRCSGKPEQVIFPAWQELVAWRENSSYRIGQHQWLEEQISPLGGDFETLTLDLYLPIEV